MAVFWSTRWVQVSRLLRPGIHQCTQRRNHEALTILSACFLINEFLGLFLFYKEFQLRAQCLLELLCGGSTCPCPRQVPAPPRGRRFRSDSSGSPHLRVRGVFDWKPWHFDRNSDPRTLRETCDSLFQIGPPRDKLRATGTPPSLAGPLVYVLFAAPPSPRPHTSALVAHSVPTRRYHFSVRPQDWRDKISASQNCEALLDIGSRVLRSDSLSGMFIL